MYYRPLQNFYSFLFACFKMYLLFVMLLLTDVLFLPWYKTLLFFLISFFWHLSSGYSCSICSYTHTRTPYTRTPHSHHTCAIRPTTTHRYEDRVLLEITGNLQGSVCDGRVAVLLWHHAWEATEIIKGTENSTWWGTRVAIPRNRTRARPLAHLRANQLSYRSSSSNG